MKLSIVIPCYNEEKNVEIIHNTIVKMLYNKKISYEMIFVNDGSKDNTILELKKLVEKDEANIKIVNFSRNFGKEAAMYAGLKESSGDYVTIIDADMQQNPSLVLKMLGILENDPSFDSVAAYQEVRKEGKVLSAFKRMFYKLINKISEVEFVNGASDFRMFRRNMVDAILSMQEYYRFSKGIFSWVGFNTYYMPYQVSERANGTSKWSFWKLFKYAIDGIVSFTTTPLRIATILGLLISFGSFIYFIIVIVQTFICGIDVPGYASLIGIALLLGGIQLLSLGIIGEYLARTYIENKKRPIYIAKEVIITKNKKN